MRLVAVAFTLSLAACHCVAVPPGVLFRCERPGDCVMGEVCSADKVCVSDGGDAGAAGGGTATGGGAATGGGSSTGGGGGAPETTCADGVDNDGDLLADCADPDCAGLTCRQRGSDPCDVKEVCRDLACPPDAPVNGSACDDGNPCTGQDQCVNGQCLGTKGDVIVTCTSPSVIILQNGACPGPSDTCGNAMAVRQNLVRSIPDAGLLPFLIFSPKIDPQQDCTPPNAVLNANVNSCGDWTIGSTESTPCGINVLSFAVSLDPFDGGVPVYQLKNQVQPLHSFGASSTGFPGVVLEPPTPIFYACPL